MIEGNRIILKHSYNRLELCEMRAYGIKSSELQ